MAQVSQTELENMITDSTVVKRKILSSNLFAESDQRLREKVDELKMFIAQRIKSVFLIEEHFASNVCAKYYGEAHSCDVDVSIVETLSDLMVKKRELCEIIVPSKDASGLAKLRYHASNSHVFESLYRFGVNRLIFDGSLTTTELYQHPLARSLGLKRHAGYGGNWAYMMLDYLCFKGRAVLASSEMATLNG